MQPMSVRAPGARPRGPYSACQAASSSSTSRGTDVGSGRARTSRSAFARACPARPTERDLSWLGSAGAREMSADGQWLLMVDVGLRGGTNYSVVLRKTDGSQTIRLGEGSPSGSRQTEVGGGHHRRAAAARGLSDRSRRADSVRRRTDRTPDVGRVVSRRDAAAGRAGRTRAVRHAATRRTCGVAARRR